MQPATAAKCAAAKVQCHSAHARRQSAASSAAPSPRPYSRQTPPAAARPTCSPNRGPYRHCSQPPLRQSLSAGERSKNLFARQVPAWVGPRLSNVVPDREIGGNLVTLITDFEQRQNL